MTNQHIEIRPALISIKQVSALTSLARSTIYKYEAAGKFPGRIRISPGRVAWILSEVEQWVAEKEKA